MSRSTHRPGVDPALETHCTAQMALAEMRSLMYWVLEYLGIVGYDTGRGLDAKVPRVLKLNSRK